MNNSLSSAQIYWHMFRAWLRRTFGLQGISLTHLKQDLALRYAVREAERRFRLHGVRYFVVPTPEGKLRVINYSEAMMLRRSGFFPKRFKVQDIYGLAFYWTAATRSPKHLNSLPLYSDGYRQRFYSWWQTTHTSVPVNPVKPAYKF